MSEARAISPDRPHARGLRLAAAVAGLAAWVGLWWAAAALLGVSADFLPSPLDVARRLQWLATNSVGEGTLWPHAGWSLLRFFSGFAAAAAFVASSSPSSFLPFSSARSRRPLRSSPRLVAASLS